MNSVVACFQAPCMSDIRLQGTEELNSQLGPRVANSLGSMRGKMCCRQHLRSGHLLVYGGIDVLQGQLRHWCSAVVCSCCAGFCCGLPEVRLEARVPLILPSHARLHMAVPTRTHDASVVDVKNIEQTGTEPLPTLKSDTCMACMQLIPWYLQVYGAVLKASAETLRIGQYVLLQ